MICTSFLVSGAIGAAVFAGVPGGGGNFCHLTWDKQCCPVPGCNVSIAPGILTICNEKPDPAEFMWELTDISGMGLQFMPSSGVAAPGMSPTGQTGPCIDIPFTVICPPNFPLGSVADYQATVTKISTGEQFSCFGNVVNVSDWKIEPAGDPVISVDIPLGGGQVGESTKGGLVVSNIGSSGKDGVSVDLEPMGPFTVSPSRLTIPPIPPGGSFTVDSFFDVTYDIKIPSQGGIQMGDILFKIDSDGDGVGDLVVGSQTVRGAPSAAPCVGDLNGDGLVDAADLGILLGVFGLPCP